MSDKIEIETISGFLLINFHLDWAEISFSKVSQVDDPDGDLCDFYAEISNEQLALLITKIQHGLKGNI